MSAGTHPGGAARRQGKLAALLSARLLLGNLISKELKVRYKSSVFGFAWSLVTPLLMTGIYTLVFANFLRIQVGPEGTFASFFLSGYLVWQFFSNGVVSSSGSIVANGSLIRKVWFPREVLPLSLVLSQAVHLLLALAVTYPLFVWQRGFSVWTVPSVLGGLALLIMFTCGMAMIFAAVNVGFRDLQEIIQVLFLAWFYATPVIYSMHFVRTGSPAFVPIIQANPMTWFVELFNAALYGSAITDTSALPPGLPRWEVWAVCLVVSLVVLGVGYRLFTQLAVTFAKEV